MGIEILCRISIFSAMSSYISGSKASIESSKTLIKDTFSPLRENGKKNMTTRISGNIQLQTLRGRRTQQSAGIKAAQNEYIGFSSKQLSAQGHSICISPVLTEDW